MSRSSLSSVTSMRSTAPMMPPALPIALATWPSMPGRWAISMRMVSEYWADGVMLIAGAYVPIERSQPAGGRASGVVRYAGANCLIDGNGVAAVAARASALAHPLLTRREAAPGAMLVATTRGLRGPDHRWLASPR